ncbi:early nodulin-like protein 15 [Magnolia sinica]|uniref:early nodulin-like protein 15 n=1 Tax=Magnolia sinica TaxID=86752 RepID=UPI002659EE4B|nr:early nodulin-like protein 15 [Magnolia sinica]
MASARALTSSLIFISFLLFSLSEAKDFLVGGKTNAWQIPSSPSDSLNQWAEANRFQIGDSLVWKFDGEKDSVLQVTREGYQSCNVSNPIAAHKGGNVVVKLDRSGPFYFISGAGGHCENGQKLIVVVISEVRGGGFFSISPAPSPMEFDGPAVAPTSSAHGLAVWRGGFVSSLVVLGSLVGMIL